MTRNVDCMEIGLQSCTQCHIVYVLLETLCTPPGVTIVPFLIGRGKKNRKFH